MRAARTLYLSAVEREVRAARGARRWSDVAALRREQAAALYEEAGSPVPPPEDILRLHQEGATAALRAMADIARQADLVGAGCCAACRADDGRTFRIADETPRATPSAPGLPARAVRLRLVDLDRGSQAAAQGGRDAGPRRGSRCAGGTGASTDVEVGATDPSAEAPEDSADVDEDTDEGDEGGDDVDEGDGLDEGANTLDDPAGPEAGPGTTPQAPPT